MAIAHMKAILLAIDVLWIIWAAFLLYRIVDEAGAIRTIGQALPRLTPDIGMQALIIGWIFASFLQGVGGFGVPVAVVSPILIGLGFSPITAVIVPSIGHGWAVTFGSMGSSFTALLAATGQPEKLLIPPAATFLGISCVFVGWMVAHSAGGWVAFKRLWLVVALLGIVMGSVQFLVTNRGFWNIGAFIASLVGLIIVFPLSHWMNKKVRNSKTSNHEYKQASSDGMNQSENQISKSNLLIALSGYGILILVILCVQLVPEIKHFLGQVVIKMKLPEVTTSSGLITPSEEGRKLNLFGHTGMLLLYASILSYLFYRCVGWIKPEAARRILSGTVSRVMPSSVSIASMLTMAVIMEYSGMTDALAQGLATGMGRLFPLASPWIGAIGAFMTGSNTNSNVVFGALQMQTAQLLGYAVPIILAGQTAGAALASIMAPTKIVVGASTAGMAGKEGEIMRKLAIYTTLLVVLISLLTLIGTIYNQY